MMLALIGLLVLFVIFILVDAYRYKVLFKIGVRNILRRKGNTIIVIMGLMVATAIISSSLSVGDTMDSMVEDEIYEEWHLTDVIIYNVTAEGDYIPMPYRTYNHMKSGIMEIVENVEDVCGEIHGHLPIFNPETALVRPNALFIGMDFNESDAFGNFYVNGEVYEPALGDMEIFIDERLSNELDANKGDYLWLINPEQGDYLNLTVKEVIDNSGRAAFGGPSKIIMNLEDAQMALAIPDQINFVRVASIGDVHEGALYSDQIASDIDELVIQVNPAYRSLGVGESKNQILETYRQDMSLFTDLFFIFGTFSIVAGIILAINIFVMLGEERKSEMGMARAVGMKRISLQRTFSYEGLVYAIAASIVGIFVGIGVTYTIFYLLEDVFVNVGGGSSLLDYFTVKIESMIIAFGAGFILTMGTIYFSVRRISNLNIVRAIRDIPEPPLSKTSSKFFYMALLTLVFGGMATMMGMRNEMLAPALTGTSLLIIGTGMIFRRWIGDRISFTVVGVFLLLWWLLPLQRYGIFVGYEGGLPIFILSGLFIVTAGVLIVMLNGEIITNLIEKVFSSEKSFKAVVVSAISHPIKERFRTGMTIFIFALIIFAITVMGMIVGIFDTNMALIIEEQSGGYEIFGVTMMGVSIDNIHELIENETATPNLSMDYFNHIDTAYSDSVDIYGSSDGSLAIGIDENFVDNSTFGMASYLEEYDSARDVWNAVLEPNSPYVITNAPGLGGGGMMGGGAASQVGAGESVGAGIDDELELGSIITFINRDGEAVEKTVIGFMEQNLIQGFFMSKETAENDFGITSTTVFFFNVREEYDPDDIARIINQEFFEYGLQTIVVDTIIRDALSAAFMFFDLFQGYMALGLVIGIAGLGVISLRAAHERRMEIGIMRAVGFERNMIRYSFLIENSFITIVGILLGTVFGIAIGWLLWNSLFNPMGWEFTIPWFSIISIGIIAYGAMLLTAMPSANKASKVSAAEALRFD